MTYTYYTIFRPPMPGTVPREGLLAAQAYDERKAIESIGRMAWGIVVYSRELTEEELEEYELVKG